MKKALVQVLEQGGNNYGQVSDPADFMKSQGFSHDRLSDAIHDFVNNERLHEVTGFSYELGPGNAFTITINKPGRAYSQDGVSFDLLADTELEIADADVALPRVDLVVAVLDDEIEAESDLIPFVRLRTAEEFEDELPPYPPQNLLAPAELHWRAVPQIKTGTPATVPTPPPAASNEVPLYLIAVASNAGAIRDDDVLDLRDVILPLRTINEMIERNSIDLAKHAVRLAKLEKAVDTPIDLSQIFGQIRTLGEILTDLQRQITSSRDLPEIRYDRPKDPLTNINTSKIIATGGTSGGVPFVDIEIGGRINFGDAEVAILPQWFKDGSVNARFAVAGSPPAGHTKREVDLTLDNVTPIATDGAVDFLERAAEFAAARSRPAAAARNGQFIEVFGGLAVDNTSQLGDWYSYDTTNDTLTLRTPLTALPNADRPALYPYGDGVHILLIAGSSSTSTPQVFKIHTGTGTVTEITTTKPTGVQFFGDLITDGKILVCAIKEIFGGYQTEFWEFSTATNTFTLLGVTGSVPDPDIDCAAGCMYADNKFVMVTFNPQVRSSGRTYLFDRPSLQWVELTINQPYGNNAEKQDALTRFRMANVNGRPLLIGGLLTKDTDTSSAKSWELKRSSAIDASDAKLEWVVTDATCPPVQAPGFASTLGDNDLPGGKGFYFAGHGKFSNAVKQIFAVQQGGLIAITHDGVEGISLADSASFAQFEVDPYTATGEIIGYWVTFDGVTDNANLRVEVSLDDGDHWHVIEPDKTFTVPDSDDPGERRLRITLFRSKTPILTKLTEVLDEDGGDLEDRFVIRYNSPNVVKALYIDRSGAVTLSTVIEPSTPAKCLIHKVTPDGVNAPAVKNYINRRRAHYKVTGVRASGTTPPFANELAVPVRYVHAVGVKASDSSIFKIAEPTVDFDAAAITPAGITTNGDSYIVEIEG